MDKKKKKKKNKGHKFGSSTFEEANETTDLHLLGKEDQNQFGAGRKTTSGSSSNDNETPLNQQFQPNVQWPYTAQFDMEQSPLICKPCNPNQSPSPIILSQWQQSKHQQSNPTIHQVQHSQPSPHLAQPAMPFWLTQLPGYHLPYANVPSSYQPLSPVGTTGVTWQGPDITGGGMSGGNQTQSPRFCYHVGFPYPVFPGPWDPSSWWTQPQQSPPPHTFPRACGYISSLPPPMSGCSAASSPSFLRGIMRPPPKLSQKHQQLWEAQSAENVQLWNVVSQLQSEVADYKNHLTKLKADILSLRPAVEEPAARGTKALLAGHTPKRGRPKRPIASNDVLPSPDLSRRQARGQNPAVCNAQRETKEPNFKKVHQNKLDDKANIQQVNDGRAENIFANCGGDIEITSSNPLLHNQIHQDIPGFKITGVCLKNSSESKTDDKVGDSKTIISVSSHPVKGIETKTASATYVGMTNNGTFVWPSNVSTKDCGRNLINISSQSFYSDNVTVHGRKDFAGWSFGDEKDASVGLENMAVESGKDEDEEIEDDGSSGAEDTA